jgi:hypothetical protein
MPVTRRAKSAVIPRSIRFLDKVWQQYDSVRRNWETFCFKKYALLSMIH